MLGMTLSSVHEMRAKLAALDRSQATIEFKLDGTMIVPRGVV
jgi:hypothetical protein